MVPSRKYVEPGRANCVIKFSCAYRLRNPDRLRPSRSRGRAKAPP